jgi:kynurenine formamidase
MTSNPQTEGQSLQQLWQALANSRVLDLSHQYRVGMPQSPNHPPFRLALERRHGDVTRADGSSAANEIFVLGGHVGTHVDALAHVSHQGKLFGGTKASSTQSNEGLSHLGIDTFEPYVGRAVLLDVAALHGVASLPPAYEVTATDLRDAADRARVTIARGDVVLVGTGWSRNWEHPELFNGQTNGAPGPGVEAAQWLATFAPRAVGAETIAFEHIPAGSGHALLPVHTIMLVEHGINLIETMNLAPLLDASVSELAVVINPLNIRGASGAPVRPLAIVPA